MEDRQWQWPKEKEQTVINSPKSMKDRQLQWPKEKEQTDKEWSPHKD